MVRTIPAAQQKLSSPVAAATTPSAAEPVLSEPSHKEPSDKEGPAGGSDKATADERIALGPKAD